jgi:hypothetical protein
MIYSEFDDEDYSGAVKPGQRTANDNSSGRGDGKRPIMSAAQYVAAISCLSFEPNH